MKLAQKIFILSIFTILSASSRNYEFGIGSMEPREMRRKGPFCFESISAHFAFKLFADFGVPLQKQNEKKIKITEGPVYR